ncbi:hypothetical protein GGR50DRAFT_239357 [Xylaria sp. CBS 124048]|nr:hypothetical protein GGR50DRAFT_239357 [Xylaria sp. CBS 124048]
MDVPPWPKEFQHRWNYTGRDVPFQGRNTYLVYLECQENFTTWLVETAAELGEPLKNHASQSMTGDMIVPFEELLHLADTVASYNRVSRNALACIEFMFKVRSEWNPENEKKETEQHDTEAIMRCADAKLILDTIVHRFRSSYVPQPAEPHHQIHDDAFLCMHINCRPCTSASAPCVRSQSGTKYTLPTLVGEGFWAWVLFFNDLSIIREYLKYLWYHYSQSFYTLTAATLITNTAIRLLRDTIKAQLRATANLPNVPPEYDIVEWICRGNTGEYTTECPFPHEWQNRESHRSCFESQIALLQRTQDNYKEIPPLFYTKIDAKRMSQPELWSAFDGERATLARDYTSGLADMLQITRSFVRESTGQPFFPCFDELTRGFFQWASLDPRSYNPKKIPLWITIALQLSVDIGGVLAGYYPTALADLKNNSEYLVSLIQKHQGHAATRLARRVDSENMPCYFELPRLLVRCLLTDNWGKRVLERGQANPRNLPLAEDHRPPELQAEATAEWRPIPNNLLLRQHPLLCGMQLWWAEQTYRRFAHWAVQLHHSIQPAAFLYLSMRENKELNYEWWDMDYVLKFRFMDILPFARSHWDWVDGLPDYFDINMAIDKTLKDIYEPGQEEEARSPWKEKATDRSNPPDQFFADLFQPYIDFDAKSADMPVPPPIRPATILNIIDNVYSNDAWRDGIRTSLYLETDNPNLLGMLDLVLVTRSLDEQLASFDWFLMQDICEDFFAKLRQEYRKRFDELYAKIDNGTSNVDIFALDVLYYITFPEASDKAVENVILVGMIIEPTDLVTYTLPSITYLIDWCQDEIPRLVKELGMTVESAASVLRSCLEAERGAQASIAAAKRQGMNHKLRAPISDGY